MILISDRIILVKVYFVTYKTLLFLSKKNKSTKAKRIEHGDKGMFYRHAFIVTDINS